MAQGYTSPANRIEYNIQVWDMVRQIPPGMVSTYGQIAQLIPPPEGMAVSSYRSLSPRWVGGAMANAPADVPWHRVINSQGKISLRGGTGYEIQRGLLEEEGVFFGPNDRVDLKKYLWQGPDASPPSQWRQASFDDIV